MKKWVLYLHGQGGNAEEAAHYRPLFPDCEVIGIPYRSETPWEAKAELTAYFHANRNCFDTVSLVANSIGAFFAMHALADEPIEHAYFISPIVDMEKLITARMAQEGVTPNELKQKREIGTLSWDYFDYVRQHPLRWTVPTHILYGENDTLTDRDTITLFAKQTGAALDTMPGGEHWFHTEKQMRYLDNWIRRSRAE